MPSAGTKRRLSRNLIPLNPSLLGEYSASLLKGLRARLVGQQAAIDAVIQAFQICNSGLASTDRPLGSFLFLGPTGTGKTRLVEALAEIFFGDRRAMLKVDCGEFSHSHEIARLTGSPPGYLGHQDTLPYLSQENISKFQTRRSPFTLLLFDEIEKANDSLWQLLLGVLDKGRLTLGNNKEVDLTSCFIFMTSNVGARGIAQVMSPNMGFSHGRNTPNQSQIDGAALHAAKTKFSPEFLGRIGHQVVFHPLTDEQMHEVLDLELKYIQERIKGRERGGRVELKFSKAAKCTLLRARPNPELGARPLVRILEKHVVHPLASLFSSEQIGVGDTVYIEPGKGVKSESSPLLSFSKLPEAVKSSRGIKSGSSKPSSPSYPPRTFKSGVLLM